MSSSIRSRSSRSRRDWSASLMTCGLQAHVLRDDRLHDLAGAAVDAVDAVVRVQAGDRVLVHVAVAAVQLEAAVDDAVGDLGAEQLGTGGLGGGELTGVQGLRGAVG